MVMRRRDVLAGLVATGGLMTWGLTAQPAHAVV